MCFSMQFKDGTITPTERTYTGKPDRKTKIPAEKEITKILFSRRAGGRLVKVEVLSPENESITSISGEALPATTEEVDLQLGERIVAARIEVDKKYRLYIIQFSFM